MDGLACYWCCTVLIVFLYIAPSSGRTRGWRLIKTSLLLWWWCWWCLMSKAGSSFRFYTFTRKEKQLESTSFNRPLREKKKTREKKETDIHSHKPAHVEPWKPVSSRPRQTCETCEACEIFDACEACEACETCEACADTKRTTSQNDGVLTQIYHQRLTFLNRKLWIYIYQAQHNPNTDTSFLSSHCSHIKWLFLFR